MAEFDQYSRDYQDQLTNSLGGLGSIDSALSSKLVQLDRIFAATGRSKVNRVLDFGTGKGLLANLLGRYADQVIGLDVSESSLHESVSPELGRVAFDGAQIPFASGSIDVAVASCVFHHITAAKRAGVLDELRRVLAPGGLMVIIEHNPWNPLTRWVVNRCEFDHDAELLSLGVARQLLRDAGFSVGPQSWFYAIPPTNPTLASIDGLAGRLPMGAQYFCCGSKPV